MTSRPRVYARLRPQNDNEVRQGGDACYTAERGHHDVLLQQGGNASGSGDQQTRTRFDYVFDADASQQDVFDHVGTEVLTTLWSGYNATIFAYGQTGSGKTHTMEGSHTVAAMRGVIPRLIEAILNRMITNSDVSDWTVHLSMCQIYQEKIQDLFNARKQLDIHLDRTGQYVAVGQTCREVRKLDDALLLYQEAVKQRATNATEMNLVSSRSHTILTLQLKWDEPSMPGCRAQLNLVDLAGSEKLYQSGATGEVMKEAISINKSLSALGNVVSKLVDAAKSKDKHVHVPYKDSKLTYLLQSSLGGSNLVHFVLALSSSSLWRSESASTIEFGKRALQLVIRPVRNPIDYKRLEEMEAMIEKMRNHIRNLEEELRTNSKQQGGAGSGAAAFLAIKQLAQEGDEKDKRARRRTTQSRRKSLKMRTELARIVANLPETLEDLTSHCVLFPSSRAAFREMGGLEKLVGFIDKSASTFYRAHAAHTVAHVIDDEGRDIFGSKGGVEALERLLTVREERCKEAACVALEAVCRTCPSNKARVKCYDSLVDLIFGYANQQVQEAACTALASIVDTFPPAKAALAPLDAVRRLLGTIRDAPDEVAHVTKAATTCLGKLAHGDVNMQNDIQRQGGVELLVDDVLFSSIGDRDHQVPILASYALVNLCCSNAANMAVVRRHPRFEEIRFKLMEGLARAFGNNTVREGFGRATAQETTSPFPYYGVTVCDDWTARTCGGRPIFSTFMENPQFYLYVTHGDAKVTLMIQDTLYEQRLQKKQRNLTVYMGLAIFQADPELAKAGLKQLDFHGKIMDIAKFTSNCENTLHCTLPKCDAPYIVVPFTSQRGRYTTFALSAFADKPVDLLKIPDTSGWSQKIVHGAWNKLTGRGGDHPDWRNNPQVRLVVKEACNVVLVVSYLSLDVMRSATGKRDDSADEEKVNPRPRLNGRLFLMSAGAPPNSGSTPPQVASPLLLPAAMPTGGGGGPTSSTSSALSSFPMPMRYIKSIIPLSGPAAASSPFVASNSFSSNSYVTTTATLQPGTYAFVPFTETPTEDSWRLSVFCDTDEFDAQPLDTMESEWHVHTVSATSWSLGDNGHIHGTVKARGPFCVVAAASAPKRAMGGGGAGAASLTQSNTFLRITAVGPDGTKVAGLDNFWHGEAFIEGVAGSSGGVLLPSASDAAAVSLFLTIEGIVKAPPGVHAPNGVLPADATNSGDLDIHVFTKDGHATVNVAGKAAVYPSPEIIGLSRCALKDLDAPKVMDTDTLVVRDSSGGASGTDGLGQGDSDVDDDDMDDIDDEDEHAAGGSDAPPPSRKSGSRSGGGAAAAAAQSDVESHLKQALQKVSTLSDDLQKKTEENIKLELRVREMAMEMARLRREATALAPTAPLAPADPPPSGASGAPRGRAPLVVAVPQAAAVAGGGSVLPLAQRIGGGPPGGPGSGFRVMGLPFDGPTVSNAIRPTTQSQSRTGSRDGLRPSISQRGSRTPGGRGSDAAATMSGEADGGGGLLVGGSAAALVANAPFGNTPSSDGGGLGYESAPLLQGVSSRLSGIAATERPPNVTEWAKLRKEMRELQLKVQLAMKAP